MKKGTAIIAEFNPFHKGHEYILKKASEFTDSAFTGVIMSGNFNQRGEPAVFDKFLRTEAALKNGADIVLELPVLYATGSADVFAYGGCHTAVSSGLFSRILFGCECGNIKKLETTADILYREPGPFKNAIKEYSDKGLSYPAAREKALSSIDDGCGGILSEPNNILAVEYLKALKGMDSNIMPIAVKREGADYNNISISEGFSSARAVKKALYGGLYEDVKKAVPENIYSLYISEAEKGLPDEESFSEILRYLILRKGAQGLKEICDVTEGLENRIYACRGFESIESLIEEIKTKRYTRTKIKRALLHILLDIKKSDAYPPAPVPYIRVLGVKKERRELLTLLKESSEVPVIINLKKDIENLSDTGKKFIEKEIFATDIYSTKIKSGDLTRGLITV